MILVLGGTKTAFHARLSNSYTTIPRCRQLLWPVATGDVSSPAPDDEMPIDHNGKYVITEELVNFHMPCV